MKYHEIKISDFTKVYIHIHNNYSLVSQEDKEEFWCHIELNVEGRFFNYQLAGENITTAELDHVRKMISKCKKNELEEETVFETLEPYFRFVARNETYDSPRFEIRLYFESSNGFDCQEFYSLGFDSDEELKLLYDALEYK